MPISQFKTTGLGIAEVGFYTLLIAANGLLLKICISQGVPVAWTVAGRGGFCLVVVMLIAIATKQSLIPTNPVRQSLRLLFAGASLTCATASYLFLTATSVSLLSRLDIPLLAIVTSRSVFSYKKTRIVFAFLTIAFLLACWVGFKDSNESVIGLILVLVAVGTIVLGYIFLRHSVKEENLLIVAGTPALACVLFGSAAALIAKTLFIPSITQLSILALLGVCMFCLYYLASRRYRHLPPGVVEFPVIASTLVTMFLESAILGQSFAFWYIISMVLVIIFIGLTVYISSTKATDP